MQGKRVLITGASDGIGKAAALELARQGADVVIAGRNETKTGGVLRQIQAESPGEHSMLLADLSSIAQTKRLAAEFLSRHDQLDALLNNAGAQFDNFARSADGYEMTFALNHLSYYLLGNLLMDALRRTAAQNGEARIVNVASSAHTSARNGLRLDNLQDESRGAGFRAYGESKLANLLFTYELARRIEGSGVTANALHPGLVKTNIGSAAGGLTGLAFRVISGLIGRSTEQGAETAVYLASAEEAAGINGKYWADKKQKRLQRCLLRPRAAAAPLGLQRRDHRRRLARQLRRQFESRFAFV